MLSNHVFSFKHCCCISVWYQKLKIHHFNIQEAEGSKQPIDDACLQEIKEEYHYLITWELSKELNVNAMSISCTTHCLKLTYKFNCWLTYVLTQVMRINILRPALICLNIKTRAKLCIGLLPVMISGFTSNNMCWKKDLISTE